MEEDSRFHDLFVLDLANNHQGSVEHALKIINSIGEIVRAQGIKAGCKFQFRQLDSFIHPSHRETTDNKHIPRFLSTRLSQDQFQILRDATSDQGMTTICTPFDEESVDVITDMKFDIMKIASCSAKDWPLLEKVASSGLPVIASTGGLSVKGIDDLVSFFEHRGVEFAIMHCVSIYPIPNDKFALNQIDRLRERYPDHVIGWSTHENPDDIVPVQIAVAKGARMFERHVGFDTASIKLNAYSSTPEQLNRWINAYKNGVKLCGKGQIRETSEVEQESIDSLRRGVYARTRVKKGAILERDQVYFAMPYIEGQLESGHWRDGIAAMADFEPDAPCMNTDVTVPEDTDVAVLKTAIHEVKAILNQACIVLNSEFEVEYSHHYGIQNFRKTGAVIINCINRAYCKKIIVQLPGQNHPPHYHERKEETFQVLYGILEISIDGHRRTLRAGETCLIQPGVWHSFESETGCIFEEISTTHFNDDSFYKDKAINAMERSARKTIVKHWGRYELADSAKS